MPQVLIRGLDPEDIAALKERARQRGRSLQAELKMILQEAARVHRNHNDFWEVADRLREQTAGRRHTDSAELIREMRDER